MNITNTVTPKVEVSWKVEDTDASGREWIYMDVYSFTQSEWENTTPEELEKRQKAQYDEWRAYCETNQG